MSYMGVVRPTIALTSADIADDAVTTAKINDDAVDADKLANSINTDIAANTAKVTNATHTGDVTGATALTIATAAVDIAMLSATGTASSSTFLRGDNAWAAAGGDNTPIFMAQKTGSTTGLTNNTWIKVEFNDEIIGTNSDYDPTTNYRFTPTVAGKYFIGAVITTGSTIDGSRYLCSIYFNGAVDRNSDWSLQSGMAGQEASMYASGVYTFNGSSDYVEVYFRNESSNTSQTLTGTGDRFWGYKLIE